MSDPTPFDRPWEIWLVHNTHVDIGYTEPQDVILRKHAEFIASVLDYCTASDHLPPGERFCWTCETSWTVKAFLARYPGRAEEFFNRVREGRIEVTALYLNLTDLYTLNLLEHTTDYALELGRQHGFEVVTAMNDDVNGWPWGLPDLLARCGVRFMDTGINETRSLGVRPRPNMFEWVGPQGGSLLFWHSNGYLSANNLQLLRPEDPRRVSAYLRGLAETGYPHHIVEMRIGGEAHDNAPPGFWLCEAVRRWNAAVETPKLRLVTARTWFEEAAARWPQPLIRHQAGWPDWWADGNGTAAYESSLARRAQAELALLPGLAKSVGVKPDAGRLERAYDAAAFFCEHTWGSFNSTDEPESLTARAQWNTKAGYAYTAAVESASLVADTLAVEAKRHQEDAPGVLVYNPADIPASGLAEVVITDHETGMRAPTWVPAPRRSDEGPALHLQDVRSGALIPAVREPVIANSSRHPGQRLRFLAAGLEPRAVRAFRILEGDLAYESACRADEGGLVGPHARVTLAPDGAGISSIRSGESAFEWLKPAEYALGEAVYERIPGPDGREKLCGWGGIRHDCPLEHTRLRYGPPQVVSLPWGAALRLQAPDLPGSLRSLSLEITVYDLLPRVDLAFRLEKLPETGAEALYVAFPLQPGTLRLDTPGAWLRPGIDQVPGTAADWHSIQHGFWAAGEGGSVVVAAPEIPLVQVGGINTGKWQASLPAFNGLVMSWVFNNYWFTNFPASQHGALEWRYSLCVLPADTAPDIARAALAEMNRIFPAAAIPAGDAVK
ncbi:MAG: glycoside hydrolase family 38 N-terminal domain-containing protein [Anaerolineae bacterium]